MEEVCAAVSPWLPEADGITISGGEPFDQPAALVELVHSLVLTEKQTVLIFSGYAMEQLTETIAQCAGRIDALISDPYDATALQSLPLRGSDNQRLHLLTDRGRSAFSKYNDVSGADARDLDIMFDADGTVWLAGIPKQRDMHRLRDLLREQGHVVTIPATKNSNC